MFATKDGIDRDSGQRIMRGGNDDDVDVRAMDRFGNVRCRRAARVQRGQRFGTFDRDIGAGHESMPAQGRGALVANSPSADDGDVQTVAHPRSAGTMRRSVYTSLAD